MTIFNLPDLGEGLVEAEIVTWHVSPGDRVVADQPLVSVETDKAVVEIPSPYSGSVVSLRAAAGDIVATGAPLVEIETGSTVDTGAVVGDLPSSDRETEAAKPPAPPAAGRDSQRTNAVPAVRRLAKKLGVDLAQVTGSGPDGAILSADVEAAVRSNDAPLRGVRRVMARTMAAAGAAVVPATLTEQADIGAWEEDINPTLRLIRAVCVACAAEPALNAGFDGEQRTLNPEVDLAIAIDTPDGLFAPVLRQVAGLSPAELEIALADLKSSVQNRSIAREALTGGTFTLSNFGMISGLHAALVVVPPQVAILGAGRIHQAVLPIEGAPAIRRILPLSLSFDHRAVTGGEAARFMRAVVTDLTLAN
jgi:pyruvate dehydrogenase E2 component (dihydrolipoamide acetyltransferase)